MLHSGTAVVVNELWDLRLTLTRGSGLIDGHLNRLLVIGNDNGAKSAEFGVHLGVVNGPESVELQDTEVPDKISTIK